MALSPCQKLLAIFRIQIPTGEQVRQPVIYTSDVLWSWPDTPSLPVEKKNSSCRQACSKGSLAFPVCMTTTVLRLSHSIVTFFFGKEPSPNLQGHSQGQHLQAIDMHLQVLNIWGKCGMEILALIPATCTSQAVTCNYIIWIRPVWVWDHRDAIIEWPKGEPPSDDCPQLIWDQTFATLGQLRRNFWILDIKILPGFTLMATKFRTPTRLCVCFLVTETLSTQSYSSTKSSCNLPGEISRTIWFVSIMMPRKNIRTLRSHALEGNFTRPQCLRVWRSFCTSTPLKSSK